MLMCCHASWATTVRLITIGPGDAFWSAFGHTGIAVDDDVYGFGYFSFDDDIVLSFIENRMQYDLGVSDLSREVMLAKQQNRDFSIVELQLSAHETTQIIDYLHWHNLPDNQSYGYDYFLSNCSTKVRDLLDRAWNENLNRKSTQISEGKQNSYFKQTFPAKHQGLMNFGLALGYGWGAYTARSSWELMAFPGYFEQYLVESFNEEVLPRQVVFKADAGNKVLSFLLTHWVLIVYLTLWSILLLFKTTRQFTAKLWFVWHGFIGLFLLALWLMTPHTVADWNFNVLLLMPLGVFIAKFRIIVTVMVLSWFCWFVLAIYLKAWYLIPLLMPALVALKTVRKTHLRMNKSGLTFGNIVQ